MSLQFIVDIHRVAGRLAAVLEGQPEIGGSAGDLFALEILRDSEQYDVAKLQNRLAVAPSTLSSILNRLERRGLIIRQGSLRDRRTFDLVLTAEGKVKAEAAHRFLEGLEDRMTGALSYAHVIAFAEVVEELERVLGETRKGEKGKMARQVEP